MTAHNWTAAADALLRAVRGMTDAAAAEELDVSESTIKRWRELRAAGEAIPEKPRGRPRVALLSVITGNDGSDGQGKDPPAYNEAREEGELARIGSIPNPLLRTMERESIAAVIRAQGMRDACRAARIEAERAPTRELPGLPVSAALEPAARAAYVAYLRALLGDSGEPPSEGLEPPAPSR